MSNKVYKSKFLEELSASPTLVALIATGSAYLIAYAYAVGYGSFFGVPLSFINISLSSLISNISLNLLLMLMIVVYGSALLRIDSKNQKAVSKLVMRSIFVIAIMLLVLYSLGALKFSILFLIIGIVVTVSGLFLIYYSFRERSLKKGAKRFLKQLSANDANSNDHMIELPKNLAALIAFTIFFTMLSFMLGSGIARSQNVYSEIISNDEGKLKNLIITKSDSEIIYKIYDSETKKFLEGVTLIRNDKDITIKRFELKKTERRGEMFDADNYR